MPISRFRMSVCDDGDVKGKTVLYFGRGLLVLGENVEKIAVNLIKPHAGEQPIERGGAYDEGHARGDCLVLDRRNLHFSVHPATK